ncbi:hypothetical protein [Crassaminicella profunda]|uniref:hypothetical protein n=1 Tax=Crassaminicella profunda TaxID=1286698 RepID=UPI001CA6DB4A|nr:hypothetical protein [Crassaminicella profunda]QZY56136.1 hypothetical protein K7H06_03800 [Crassaminicella profunda]
MEIFDVIGAFLNNPKEIEAGFKEVFGLNNKYLLVKDKEDNLICVSYEGDYCRALAEEYLKRQGLDKTLVKFETKSIKNKDEQLKEIIKYKIVALDKELVLYKDVEKKAEEYVIKGYTGKFPKYGTNDYTTVSKK